MYSWALTICVSCILVGALELVLPKKEYVKSIKTVLALYILISIFYPIQKLDWGGLQYLQNNQINQPIDYSKYQASLEKTALQNTLNQKLIDAGIKGTVEIATNNPTEITIHSENPEQAYQIISDALENMEQVLIKNEDLSNDK